MKGVLDILYKWCGALHRGAIRTFMEGYNKRSTSLEFVGGSITITVHRPLPHSFYDYTISFEYSESGAHQVETWSLITREIVLKIDATKCKYLKVGDAVLINEL